MFLKWLFQSRREAPEPNRPLVRSLKLMGETDHYVWLAPPNPNTRVCDLLTELEWVRAAGYRPLFALQGMFIHPSQEGIVCEKLEAAHGHNLPTR